MKPFYKIVLLTGFILIAMTVAQAQITETKLNQIELMKQFIGTWESDFGNGTVLTSNNKPFGNGLICTSKIVNNNKTLDTVTQLYGYDKIEDKFIIAELKESSDEIEICSAWFTSKSKGEIVITNPENAPYRFTFEFKSPGIILQRAIEDDKMVNEITLTREK